MPTDQTTNAPYDAGDAAPATGYRTPVLADELADTRRLAAALDRAASARIDNRDRIWRPGPDGTWTRHPFAVRDLAQLDTEYGPTWAVLLVDIDPDDDQDDPTTAERLATTAQAARDTADALARTEAERDQLAAALADCVTKAVEYGQQGDGHIAFYLLPTGPIHRAIPLLQDHGITVRPGFDGRAAAGLGSPAPRAQDDVIGEHFEWACRWLDTNGKVLDEMPTHDNAHETAEERAHRLARNRPPSVPVGEVVRYRVVTTEEVVATDPANTDEREG